MDIKKVIIVAAIGIGAYLLLSKRKAFAEEVSEIPSTPSAPDNPAINMVDQILKDAKGIISLATEELIVAREKAAKLVEEERLLVEQKAEEIRKLEEQRKLEEEQLKKLREAGRQSRSQYCLNVASPLQFISFLIKPLLPGPEQIMQTAAYKQCMAEGGFPV